MRVRTRDDEIFEGETADEIVQQMSDGKFRPARSLAGYRRATARRVKELFDAQVDPTNSETFIQTMIQEKLLERLDEEASIN